METDKRIETHLRCLDISAEIESNNSKQKVKVIDISRGGACVDPKIPPNSPARITIVRDTPQSSCNIKNRECQIIEHKDKSHTGIQFTNRLTQDEMDILGLPKKETLDFAKMDYNLVQGEIIDIKSCRTNIFMGTLGVIGTVAVAIVVIVGSETSTEWPTWLSLASMIPIALLTSALLSTAHKARGLNLRVSFLEVMGEYLSMGEAPIGYRGWYKTKQLLERCQIYLNTKNPKNKNCKYYDKSETEKSKRIQPGCIKAAKEAAVEINKGLPTFPPFLHSFNSLSAYIYTIAYFIASMAVVIGFIPTMQKYMIFDSKQNYILISITVSILSIFLGLLSFYRKKKEEQEMSDNYIRDQKNILEIFIKYYGYLAAFLLPTFIITLLFSNKTESSVAIFTLSNGIGALISITLFAIWYCLYDKILSLRRGRYSVERWRHIWQICLTECPLMKL